MIVRASRIGGQSWASAPDLHDTYYMYRQSRRARATFLMAVALLGIAGCSTTSRTQGAAELTLAVDDYNAQRYDSARQRAERLRHSGGGVAVQAAYIQGISAYQLGADDEAARALTEAAGKSRGQDAGRARAALGLVAMRQGRTTLAVESFRTAAQELSGEDARLASAWAIQAGSGNAGLPGSTHTALPAGPDGTFTIQVGAFHGRPRAESAAQAAEALGQRHGVAPVRIVQRHDHRGEPLFIVQLGCFGSRDEAADARRRVGNLQYIVASLGG
jgi:hypothetical protein